DLVAVQAPERQGQALLEVATVGQVGQRVQARLPLQFLPVFGKRLFGGDAAGDVAGGDDHVVAVAAVVGREAARYGLHPQVVAVLVAQPVGVGARLAAGQDFGHRLAQALAVVGMDEVPLRAQQFVRRPAQHFGGRGRYVDAPAVGVHACDGVVRMVGEHAVAAFAVAHAGG